MRYHESIVDLIGDTPLVRLGRLTDGLAPTVLAKLESFNPGGSAKDRPALSMVLAAERDGRLRPGGTIVEPTSGNTGVGLALVAQQRGYRCVFTCPDKVAPEKIAVLRAYGAEVVVCPAAVPPDHPESYRSVSARLAEEIPGGFRPDQYANPDNPAAHYRTTGPEIWSQTEGAVTHFVAGVGTGGTISGTGRYLKEVSGGRVRVIGADPDGSVYSGGQGRPYFVEGVGQPSLPAAFDPDVPDRVIAVSDQESVSLTRRLAATEGILTGGSGGMAVAAALAVARECDRDAVVVVLIPDSGRGYVSKIFDDGWARRFGFASGSGEPVVGDVLGEHGWDGELPVIDPADTIGAALKLMRATGSTHLAVSSAPPPVRFAEIVGTVAEPSLTERVAQGQVRLTDSIATHMSAVLPTVGRGQSVAETARTVAGAGAALVLDGGLPCGIVTPRDIVAALELPTPA